MKRHAPQPLTRPRFVIRLVALAIVLAICVLFAATVGAGRVTLLDVLGVRGPLDRVDAAIFYQVRLPRVLLGAILGGSLATAGAVFQAILRNPLADPYVLGVSGGASIGGLLGLLAGVGTAGALGRLGVAVWAFAGALVALVVVERLATVRGRLTIYTMLLTGAVMNAFAGAVIYFIQSIASLEELHAIVFYLMGSVPSLSYTIVATLGVAAAICVAALLVMTRDYNVMSLGEDSALQLGVDVERVRRRTFVIGSCLTGIAVATAGLIGFVGLVVPHLLRLLFGPDHRLFVPAAFLGGAAFLVLADLLARWVIAPSELPVGVLTAMIGGPFFLLLMRRRVSGAASVEVT